MTLNIFFHQGFVRRTGLLLVFIIFLRENHVLIVIGSVKIKLHNLNYFNFRAKFESTLTGQMLPPSRRLRGKDFLHQESTRQLLLNQSYYIRQII